MLLVKNSSTIMLILVLSGFFAHVVLGAGVLRKAKYPDCLDCGICQERARPICGTDGLTYFNPCHLGCQKQCRSPGLRPAHEGECKPANAI